MGPKPIFLHIKLIHIISKKKNLTLKKQIKAWQLQHHFEGKHVFGCGAPL